eukprot:TRINITY_DN4365_c0_g1_i2.p1 TRINITY_DN4365_c0_g1~~TRINITY_DN4365_c0_g1_i2.p1  ORF type:complete len:200 (-),score=31.19 TRINITY_DN4365_c0_g1_i2:27-626(-)
MRGIYRAMEKYQFFDFIDLDRRLNEGNAVYFKDWIIFLAVDTTDVKIRYSKDHGGNRNQQFSMKNHQYSVKFETATTMSGEIVWYNGPYFHNSADITIFRNHLQKMLGRNEGVFADKAYIGEDQCITPLKKRSSEITFTPDQVAFNDLVSGYRAVVECINADLMAWMILFCFKGKDLVFLRKCFVFISNLVNLKRGYLQ